VKAIIIDDHRLFVDVMHDDLHFGDMRFTNENDVFEVADKRKTGACLAPKEWQRFSP